MTITEVKRRNKAYDVVYNALTANTVTYVPMTEHTERMVILVKSAAATASTVTIKAGDADVWGGLEDLAVTTGTTAGSEQAIVIDTARYLITKGANANCIAISSTATDSIAVIYTC